ncbi:hypothetical protein [Hymenobacter metallicola]|uniref:Uncharacterized protein n=1 Tax=Hymenobacter metallicola TaxID=2563114 RepID=A0A4Z0QIA2_9BACT|nr:hypothetical protein [Hymenobacter metallicola]TGE29808.1 hypothetical protein E5K02_10215 [Hymenobacter metallicola]
MDLQKHNQATDLRQRISALERKISQATQALDQEFIAVGYAKPIARRKLAILSVAEKTGYDGFPAKDLLSKMIPDITVEVSERVLAEAIKSQIQVWQSEVAQLESQFSAL